MDRSRLLSAAAGTALLGLAAAVAAPFVFADQIAGAVLARADAGLDASITAEETDLHLGAFPSLGLQIHGLEVNGAGAFEGQTLVSVPEAVVEVDLFDLLGGTTTVRSVRLTEPTVSLVVDESGRANYDITKDPPPPKPLTAMLRSPCARCASRGCRSHWRIGRQAATSSSAASTSKHRASWQEAC